MVLFTYSCVFIESKPCHCYDCLSCMVGYNILHGLLFGLFGPFGFGYLAQHRFVRGIWDVRFSLVAWPALVIGVGRNIT